MTTLLQALADILRSDLRIPGPIVLEEKDQRSTCEPITLYTLDGSEQSILLRPDRVRRDGEKISVNDRLFPLFKETAPKFTAMCDYIIFYLHGAQAQEELFVLHCELKSNKLSGSRQQIENGKLLADYVLAKAAHHAAIRTMPAIKHRGLVFSPKIDVRMGDFLHIPCPYESWPEGFMDLPHVRYKSGRAYPLRHFCV